MESVFPGNILNFFLAMKKLLSTIKKPYNIAKKMIIRFELMTNSQLLCELGGGKKILLADYHMAKNVLREIARLRERTFRKIGEGTGKRKDSDKYDKHYNHVILWDDEAREIMGAYRVALGREIMEQAGPKAFYTASLYNYSPEFHPKLSASIELGRSFIRERYWNSRALDYLWRGIGAILALNPEIRYLFGPVSISRSYSEDAIALIVAYYKKWFGDESNLVRAKTRYTPSRERERLTSETLTGETPAADYRILKSTLKQYGFTVPVLYRRYTELCEPDGVKMLDFSVDKAFSDCVDGFLFMDISRLKPEKRKRYIRLT